MSLDQEMLRHRQTWLGFARLMRWTVAVIAITLIGMAMFLT
jgi:Bacterial aa3 type cytochrome c oxidase subunit IV